MIKKIMIALVLTLVVGSFFQVDFSETKYTIQVGAYKQDESVQKAKAILLAKDIDCFEEVSRLVILNHGVFDLYSEALDRKREIDSKGIECFIKQIALEEIPQAYLKSDMPTQEYSVDISRSALNVILEEDSVFTGVYGGKTLFFTINPHWEMSDNGYMVLRYAHSIPEEYWGSTMSVLVNGVPVYSILLNNKTENIEEVKIPIGKEALREGVNELTIRTYHRLTSLVCDDDSNPGNWVVVYKNSHLHLDYSPKVDGNTLKEYPYPYLHIGANDPIAFEVLLGEGYTKEHLKTALLMSADMGKRLPFENIEPSIGLYTASRNYSKNIIFVGDERRLPDDLRDSLTDEELEASRTKGLIKEVVSPYNLDKKALIIISDQYEFLLKSVQVLSREVTNNQLNDSKVMVDQETWLNTSVNEQDEYVTLEEMGYGQITMAGQRFASAVIDYKVSDEWVLRNDAHLYLKLRYTDVIDFDNSSVTVKINGIPIFSKKLVPEGVKEDAFFVELPSEVSHFGFLRVEVQFTLDVIMDCENGSFDPNVWAYIAGESYFYLPHDQRLISTLENYPYPLISDGLFNEFKFVVQKDHNIGNLGALFAYLGHSLREITDFDLYYDGDDITPDGHILYIGNPSTSDFMKVINNGLTIGYDQELKGYRREDLDLIALDEGSVSLVQLAELSEGTVMALTGLDQEVLFDAMRYLYDFEYVNRLSGYADAIFFNGEIQVLIEDEAEQKRVSIDEKRAVNTEALQRISGSEVRRFIIFVGIILFGIFVVVILRRNH
jgi:hypothetical protein